MFTCPVCLFSEMPDPPQDYHICPCCGTEFGNDDADCTYDQLRDRWIRAGAPWFFGPPPHDWSPQAQLLSGSLKAGTKVDAAQADVKAMMAAAGAAGLGDGPTFNPLLAGGTGLESTLGEL